MKTWPSHFGRVVRPVLIDKVERDHRQPDSAFRRRRIVVAVVLAVGATLLGISLAVRPGDPAFYPLTVALAAWFSMAFRRLSRTRSPSPESAAPRVSALTFPPA